MPARQLDRIAFERYLPSTALVPTPGPIAVDCQNVWFNGSLVYSSKGAASAGSSGGVASLQTIAGTHGGMTGSGSGTKAFGVYWYGGSGNLVVGGSVIGAASSTVTLSTGSYTGAAGLTAPGAPTIADSGVSGRNNGSYSICLTAIRSTTGAESSRGAISNVVSVKNKKIRITAWPSVPSGADTWGIYCSRRGFGAVGNWYHLADVPTSTGSNYDIQWYDGELGALPELDNDPPPSGVTHVFAINSIVVGVVSADLYPSKRAFPEAYPPTSVISIPGGSPVTACKATGIEGTVIVSTGTSLNLVRDSGVDDAPIQVQQWWPDIGFPNGNCWCVVEDTIIGFHGGLGLIMAPIGGDYDLGFAADVQYKLKQLGWVPSSTVVGYDPKTNCVIVASGSAFLAGNRTTRQWSYHTLPVGVTTSVTTGGALQLSSGGGTLYNLESGSGTSWFITSQWRDGGYAGYPKTLVGLRGNVSVSCTMDVYKNLNSSSSQATKTAAVNHGTFHHLNVQSAETYCVKFSGSDSGGTQIYGAECQFVPHGVRV